MFGNSNASSRRREALQMSNETHFWNWYARIDREFGFPIELTPLFEDGPYGYLSVDPLLATDLLGRILGEQTKVRPHCSVEYEDGIYYVDAEYLDPQTKKRMVTPRDNLCVERQEYSHYLMELTRAGLLDMRWHKDEYGSRDVALRVNVAALALAWRQHTQAGASVFEPDGFVYLLQAGPYYKIGRSKDPDKRAVVLKIQLPFPVELVHAFPAEDYVTAESTLHEVFDERRKNGEWFVLEDHEASWIQRIEYMRGNAAKVGDEE